MVTSELQTPWATLGWMMALIVSVAGAVAAVLDQPVDLGLELGSDDLMIVMRGGFRQRRCHRRVLLRRHGVSILWMLRLVFIVAVPE